LGEGPGREALTPALSHRERGKTRVLWAVLGLLASLAATAYALDRLYPPDLSRLEATGTEVLDRSGRLVALLPAPGGVWRFRATTDDVSRDFLDLLIATEDRRFWWHPGVDPVAIGRAVVQWARAGRVVSGGSTLAMQAARLLEPRPRTLRSKLIEAARALQLEWRYGKRGVLSIWLTLAPYGGNLEGVRAGARAWFGSSAAALDPAEAALLVALPRHPESLRPDRHPDRAERVRDRVLAEAQGVPVPVVRRPFPRHAAQALVGLARDPVLRTTLDLSLQAGLERLVADRLDTLPEHASIAVVVADARSREIRALVSGRWRDESRAGMLDLTRAVRSPGSALKPFLYALAFEQGIVRPETAISDLPRHFGGYAPENYMRGHAGQVSAAEALRRSLNLPAVALLEQIGPLRFAEALREAGAKPRLPPGADPALPLALGGAGLTLREMAGLYAGLATGGHARLTLTPEPARPRTPPSEVARLVADILTQPLPGGPPGIAWKTGTSWGGRDAWAFGFDQRHVVGVWFGRPDGTPLPGATGRSLAVPLLANVFDLLPSAPRPIPPPIAMAAPAQPPAGLRLLFPPPDAVLSADGPVTLRAMGGRRPLTFLIDGAPLSTQPAQRQAGWLPPGPGFYTVSVLDADGLVARAPVRVR
jgi:penicillin-binding protein 1C